MMHVIKKQPWVAQNHNILLELYHPSKPLNQYQFEYLYTNVKLYGIPREARTPRRINDILNQIGHPSDLEEQSEFDINRDELYALARVKLNVNRAAVDKLFVPISPTRRIIVFIHYEKIRRICTFCAAFFHNRADCPDRHNRVLTTGDDPIDQFHKWMTRVSALPWEMVHTQIRENTPREILPSAILTDLRAQYANLIAHSQLPQSSASPTPTLQLPQPHQTTALPTQGMQIQDTQMVDQQEQIVSAPQHNNDNQLQSMQWQPGEPSMTTAQFMSTQQLANAGDQPMGQTTIQTSTVITPIQQDGRERSTNSTNTASSGASDEYTLPSNWQYGSRRCNLH